MAKNETVKIETASGAHLAVLASASKLDNIKGVATIGAPADPQHVQHLFAGHLEAIKRDGVAEVPIGGRPIRLGQEFVDDLMQHDAPKKYRQPQP